MGSWHNLSSANQVVQCLLTCFRCTYLLHYAWIYPEMQMFSMLTVPAKVQKNMGADCSAFNFCSWWCDGIYEEWKPEILGCRRHISPRPVLRPHSTPSEACLCIINRFRYTNFFLVIWSFPVLGSFINLDFSPDIFLILRSRYICRTTVSDGVSLQEVREDIPSRCCVTRVPGHGRRLLPWDLA
jgi:hypothetical protein